jgi:hypothetical protein
MLESTLTNGGFMKRMVLGTLAGLGLAILALAITPAPAKADTITVGLQETGVNGGAITPVDVSTLGSLAYDSTYGTFTVNLITANGTPGNPEPDLGTTTSNTSSTTAGTLYVYVTEQGLSSPTGVNSFFSSLTANVLPAGWTVTESTLVSTSNALYTGTGLDSNSFTAIGTQTQSDGTPSLANPYSETEEYVITATGAGQTEDTIQLSQSVPEAGSLSMLAIGLLGVALLGFGRRSKVMVAA